MTTNSQNTRGRPASWLLATALLLGGNSLASAAPSEYMVSASWLFSPPAGVTVTPDPGSSDTLTSGAASAFGGSFAGTVGDDSQWIVVSDAMGAGGPGIGESEAFATRAVLLTATDGDVDLAGFALSYGAGLWVLTHGTSGLSQASVGYRLLDALGVALQDVIVAAFEIGVSTGPGETFTLEYGFNETFTFEELVLGSGQTLVLYTQAGGAVVPEPGTLALLGAVLVAVAARRGPKRA